ncbi:hypothetical protein [Bacillus paramycoides]|uniref:hypothetical protein n=1 Tax=Bacillus paramycoides TaxID=2026194 RepID=UPI002E1D5752|nr:hypothetical protein [Bacillus paramycoides]MED1559608.1 hypothetical protein [Bacillus paramycoides]
MIKTRTVILIVSIAIIFCLSLSARYHAIFDNISSSNIETASSIETANNTKDATSETKKETLYIQLDKLDYNKETNKLDLSLSTNIPDSTKATIKVYSSKKSENYDYTTTSSKARFEGGKLQKILYPSYPVKMKYHENVCLSSK